VFWQKVIQEDSSVVSQIQTRGLSGIQLEDPKSTCLQSIEAIPLRLRHPRGNAKSACLFHPINAIDCNLFVLIALAALQMQVLAK